MYQEPPLAAQLPPEAWAHGQPQRQQVPWQQMPQMSAPNWSVAKAEPPAGPSQFARSPPVSPSAHRGPEGGPSAHAQPWAPTAPWPQQQPERQGHQQHQQQQQRGWDAQQRTGAHQWSSGGSVGSHQQEPPQSHQQLRLQQQALQQQVQLQQQQQQLQRQDQLQKQQQQEQLQLEWQQQQKELQQEADAAEVSQQQELQQQHPASQGSATENPGLLTRLWGGVSRNTGSQDPQHKQPLKAPPQALHEQPLLHHARREPPSQQPLLQPRQAADQALQPVEVDLSSNHEVQEAMTDLKVQQRRLQQLEQDLLRNGSQRQHQERIEAARAAGTSEYQPVHEHCTPRCSYTCETPKCDEECHQVCESPTCQTRCKDVDLSGCRMNCGKPHCAVICPQDTCMDEDCPQCETKCSEPMCMLECPRAQPCHNACEHPKCDWKCKAPSTCPKPTCRMACETPHDCVGSTFKELPPLQQGEMLVQSFAAPANLPSRHDQPAQETALRRRGGTSWKQNQASRQTMRVPVQSLASTAPGQEGVGWQSEQQLVDLPVMVHGGQ
mmetsp:Transcript_105744/g.286991  ORF Transcript_105744/g.286991 Transcript_105744/m.286991 type:complete len:551 (+) Transcript_105744:168-1820(+)